MIPSKIITIVIHSHGQDIVDRNYIIPRNVRILSAAGAPGCYNFGSILEREIVKTLAADTRTSESASSVFNTYQILNQLRRDFIMIDKRRGYGMLEELFKETERSRSRYIPVEGSSSGLAAKRTTKAIFSESRFKIIKSTTEHKYMFTPKTDEESKIFPDGIYVIDTINNPDSGLKFGDNLAERRFDINEQAIKFVSVGSIHDIKNDHINYVRRKFGPYLGLANLYIAVANISPFNSVDEVSQWVTENYEVVDNIYKFGCMKLFQTGTNPSELKALMCATVLGEKFLKGIKGGNNETDIFTAILNRFNLLTEAQKPKFKTGLTPVELDTILSNYNVSSNPTYVGAEWDDIRNGLVELFTSVSMSNKMIPVPDDGGYNSENIETANISQIIRYLKGLGYDGINIIDFSCRVNPDLTELQMEEEEKKEAMSPRTPNTNWGGKIFKQTRRKYFSKKSKSNKKTKGKKRK